MYPFANGDFLFLRTMIFKKLIKRKLSMLWIS